VERVRVLLSASTILRGQGEALNIDRRQLYTQLYAALLALPMRGLAHLPPPPSPRSQADDDDNDDDDRSDAPGTAALAAAETLSVLQGLQGVGGGGGGCFGAGVTTEDQQQAALRRGEEPIAQLMGAVLFQVIWLHACVLRVAN
jgi:hypothetical protein